MNLRELKEKRGRLCQEVRDLQTQYEGKSMSSEERERWDRLLSDIEEVDAQIEQVERSQRIIDNAPSGEASSHSNEDESRMNAFRSLLRGDITPEQRQLLAPTPEQRVALSILPSANLVPSTIANAIELAMHAIGGIYNAVDILRTNSGGKITIPTANSEDYAATIVAAGAASTKKAAGVGGVDLAAHTLRTPIIPVSIELIQDSSFNLAEYLGGLLAQSFIGGAEKYIVSGTGSAQPKGLTLCSNIVTAAGSADITFDDIIDLTGAVGAAYDKNAAFAMNKKTLVRLMKIKGNDGRYIYTPSIAADVPATILGSKIILSDEMPDVAASAAAVVYGDFKKYKLRMAKDCTFQIYRELYAENLSVGFQAFGRIDGNLIDAGTHPIAVLKMQGA